MKSIRRSITVERFYRSGFLRRLVWVEEGVKIDIRGIRTRVGTFKSHVERLGNDHSDLKMPPNADRAVQITNSERVSARECSGVS